MAMTAMERMRTVRARRRRRTLVLSVEVHEVDRRQIARRGTKMPPRLTAGAKPRR